MQRFQHELLAWYNAHGRLDLPWRNTRDAYAVYVSEVMLQQTQVRTVLERFYQPFLNAFPTLHALSMADEPAVLRAWQGLGYYSRALNMRSAAQQCGGQLPAEPAALMALPGIGRNTAHAIACFGFGKPYAVMEANVRRVLHRYFGLEKASEGELWNYAEHLLNRNQPFDHNQAMMDLGSLVCTNSAPRCDECPVRYDCKGRDAPERYLPRKAKKSIPVRHVRLWVLRNAAGAVYMHARDSRFLKGLYGFHETPADSDGLEWYGRRLSTAKASPLGRIQQSYSHFTLEAEVLLLQAEGSGEGWYSPEALAALPVSMAEKKVLALLESHAAMAA